MTETDPTNLLLWRVLLPYLCFIPLLTFHEFAHAWMAWKCGDPTAKDRGRVSLNPLVHMEFLGTVVLPLVALYLGASGSHLASFIIGWGKPVPVSPWNLRRRRRDDSLVALAGPGMNLLLAALLMACARLADLAGVEQATELFLQMTVLSLALCFFNLLPVPPLDGSHVVKNLINLSDETYARLCQYGFLMVIIVIQIRPVRQAIGAATWNTTLFLARLTGLA